MISLYERMLPDPIGIELATPDHQSDAHPTEPPRPAVGQCYLSLLYIKSEYRIRHNYRTLRLGFSKLLENLVVKYVVRVHLKK